MAEQEQSPQADAAEQKRRANAELTEKWLKAITARRQAEDKWRDEQAPAVIKRYRDDRDASSKDASRFNIFWANTETLKPAIFARMPVPDVRRRYATRDPAARTAALMLERALSYCIDSYDTEDTFDRVVEDYLLPGRAVAAVRYKPTIEAREHRIGVEPLPDDEESDESKEPTYPEGTLIDDAGAYRTEMREEVIYHETHAEYVPWNLFVFGQAKCWKKVPWIAIGALLNKSEVKAQYKHLTEAQCDAIPFTHSERESKDGHGKEQGSFALFWDVWHKASRQFFVFADGHTEEPIHQQDDPLKLECFYPAPEPMYSIRTNLDWCPKPEFLLYQDQAIELDEATERLACLTQAVKVRGVSDQAFDNESVKLSELFKKPDLTVIPIANFRTLVEKGGLKSILDTLPLEQITVAMQELRLRIQELKQVIYEITGISDIVRGATVASETLGAQQLKAQYSGLRISKRQARFQRFCRDLFRIKAEIIAEHFDPQTLKLISGIQVLPDALYAEAKQKSQLTAGTVSESEFNQAIEILRSDKLRGFKVDVETDSTIPADKQNEQQQRVEFVTAVSTYLREAMAGVQAGLIPAAVAREGLLFAVRAFKIGSEFEEVLEQLGQGQDEEGLRKQLTGLQQQVQRITEQNEQLTQENAKLKTHAAAKLEEAKTDSRIKEFAAGVDARIREREAAHEMRLQTMQATHTKELQARDAQFNSQLTAIQSRFDQRLDMARERGKPMQLHAENPKVDKTLGEIVKRQDSLSKAMEALAQAVTTLIQQPKASKRRTGKAKLPSGGMLEFEVNDG